MVSDGSHGIQVSASGALGTGAFAAAYVLPTATNSILGGVKPDDTSIVNSSGAISVTLNSINAANQQLSNLSSVVLNASLNCASSGSCSLGGTNPFANGYFTTLLNMANTGTITFGVTTTELSIDSTLTNALDVGTSTAAGDYSGTLVATKLCLTPTNCITAWPSGGGLSGLTQYGAMYAASSTTAATIAPPTTNGFYQVGYNVTGNVALAPSAYLAGQGGRAIVSTTSTDTIFYSDNTTTVTHDRGASNGVTETLPTATSLGNPGF
jgi:hypothetical protein